MTKSKPTTPKKSESAKSKTKTVRAKKKVVPGKDLFDTLEITLEEIEDRAEDAWHHVQVNGFYVDKDEIPECTADDLVSIGLIEDEDRVEKLENGAQPSKKEKELFREYWLGNHFGGESMTHFGLVKVQGRVVLLFSHGSSFEGISVWVSGYFDTWEEAFNSLDQDGVRDGTTIIDSDLQKSLGKYEN
jgi:hypothetical protein